MSEQTNASGGSQFALQRLYIKDMSFESPKSPDVFIWQWKPAINLELNSHHQLVGTDVYEVVLNVTVTVKKEEGDVVYLAEVQQAGIFLVKGMDAAVTAKTLGSFCPSLLFPYAREAIDSLVVKGSFPPLMLSPVNFDAIYEQSRQRQAAAAAQGGVVN
jgi:preprotein translocase subunit SecB